MGTRSALVYKQLVQHSVRAVFGYAGGPILPLLDQFHHQNNYNNINFIFNTNEQNCGYAATGYAKASGRTGVAIVTSGPGITNCVTPLLDAKNDSVPLVVISGNVPLHSFGKDSFQEADAVRITEPVTKWSYFAQPHDDIIEIIDYAFDIANHGRKGSVHIDIPLCVMTGKNSKGTGQYKLKKTTEPFTLSKPIEDIARVIVESSKPVLHVGQGAVEVYKEVRQLSKEFDIPVVTTLHGVGVADERDKHSLQMGGVHGNVAANKAIQNADCIISIGARFDDRSTGAVSKYAPMCKNFVHLNIEESEINKVIRTDHYIVGDVNVTLSILTNTLHQLHQNSPRRRDSSWIEQITEWKKKHPFAHEESEYLKTPDVLIELDRQIRNDMTRTLITTGVGNHQMNACQYITWSHPQRLITSGSLGVMGTGLPYAIGAQLAFPDNQVIDIDGDGSLLMTINDLKTVTEYNLPVKILVMNNSGLDMIRAYQENFIGNRIVAVEFSETPNYAAIAEGFGIRGITCPNKENLEECMDIFLGHKGPILMDCHVKQEFALPYAPPGAGLSEMIVNE